MPSTFIKYIVEFTIEEQDDCGPDEILEKVIAMTGDDDASVEVVDGFFGASFMEGYEAGVTFSDDFLRGRGLDDLADALTLASKDD